jgi:outer membrane lipoprotein-sorting protein
MKFLRTASTRRLLAVVAGVVAIIAAGTAIAIAATGSGPVPPSKPLAAAVHNALGAPQVKGITARISFSNHLIDSSSLQGTDPILTGATGRLWLAPHRLRLELQAQNGQDAQVVVSNGTFWVYDPASNTAYEGKLPSDGKRADKASTAADRLPSIASMQSDLNRLARRVNLTGAVPSDVAGQPAYTVRVSPKHDGGMLGAAEVAWDAVRGVPLRFAIYARGESSPVIELKATDISYGTVAASDFAVSPPSGAKVVKITLPAGNAAAKHARGHGRHHDVTGAAAVAKRLPFALVAPNKLVGLPRQSVSLLDSGGSRGALITYGQNLGGIAVIEQPAHAGAAAPTQSGDHSGLSLPSVSINGATGQELDTALGSVVRFTRNGVSYTVLGSVPAAAADAAARAL